MPAPVAGSIQRATRIFEKASSDACSVRTKKTLAMPHTIPRIAKAGAVAIVRLPPAPAKMSAPTPKSGSCVPRIVCTVAAAKTDAMTIGVNVRSEKSRSSTSSTKKIPVIGALKTAAIPAAAPHPTSVVAVLASTRRKRAITDPSVAPIVTIGPSGPAEPPVEMIAVEPSQVRTARTGGSWARLRWMAYSTLETPCARSLTGKSAWITPQRIAPRTGTIATAITTLSGFATAQSPARCSNHRMGRIKASAITASVMPVTAAQRKRRRSRVRPIRLSQRSP